MNSDRDLCARNGEGQGRFRCSASASPRQRASPLTRPSPATPKPSSSPLFAQFSPHPPVLTRPWGLPARGVCCQPSLVVTEPYLGPLYLVHYYDSHRARGSRSYLDRTSRCAHPGSPAGSCRPQSSCYAHKLPKLGAMSPQAFHLIPSNRCRCVVVLMQRSPPRLTCM